MIRVFLILGAALQAITLRVADTDDAHTYILLSAASRSMHKSSRPRARTLLGDEVNADVELNDHVVAATKLKL